MQDKVELTETDRMAFEAIPRAHRTAMGGNAREAVLVSLARHREQATASLRRQIANLEANDIHTCHADCQRPLCVAQREIASLREERDALQESLERISAALSSALGEG